MNTGPVTPALANDQIWDTKNFKQLRLKREDIGSKEATPEDITKMNSWTDATPLGTPRFRFSKGKQYIYDYPDNGYR